ncbi:MAG: 1-phosphofructokinase [Clostridia bacterium]|nr:1-phosphofructokinase [Clostridia bacterium]
MITTVCLNPAIDRSISIAEFTYGGMNRVKSVRNDAGGKGVNVAVTLARLGLETQCISFLHKNGGKEIENRLLTDGVKSAGVWLDGTLRTNIKLLDMSKNVVTEINESGAAVSESDLQKMNDMIARYAQESDFLVLSGSLPPGCPADYYRTIIESLEGTSCRCVLDADGAKLTEGLKAKPYLIKPNQYELELLVGRPLSSLDDIKGAALDLIDRGISIVAVSMGGDGAMITDGTQCIYAPRLNVEVRSTVGAGDAMIAGLTAGCLAELPLEEIFVKGVACATASVMTEGTQLIEKAAYKSLIPEVEFKLI